MRKVLPWANQNGDLKSPIGWQISIQLHHSPGNCDALTVDLDVFILDNTIIKPVSRRPRSHQSILLCRLAGLLDALVRAATAAGKPDRAKHWLETKAEAWPPKEKKE